MTIVKIIKPSRVIGKSINLRNADVDDAEFILNLRNNPLRNKHISVTSELLSKQKNWLVSYSSDPDQVYFIIENKSGEKFGTVRIYDCVGQSFCWGSWILKPGSPHFYSIESAILIYKFAKSIGFVESHFQVRKANESVWKFHERFGAYRVAEDDDSFHYKISDSSIDLSLQRYQDKFLENYFKIER